MAILLASLQHPKSFSVFCTGFYSLQRLFKNCLSKYSQPQPGNSDKQMNKLLFIQTALLCSHPFSQSICDETHTFMCGGLSRKTQMGGFLHFTPSPDYGSVRLQHSEVLWLEMDCCFVSELCLKWLQLTLGTRNKSNSCFHPQGTHLIHSLGTAQCIIGKPCIFSRTGLLASEAESNLHWSEMSHRLNLLIWMGLSKHIGK